MAELATIARPYAEALYKALHATPGADQEEELCHSVGKVVLTGVCAQSVGGEGK